MNDPAPVIRFDPLGFPYPSLVCDSDGQVTLANAAAEQALGPCRGRHISRVFPVGGDLFHEFRVGRGSPGPRPCRLDGEPHLALFSSRPGEAFSVTVLPVPERRAESPLCAQMRAALDEISEGVWIVSGDGMLQYINKTSERLNGVRFSELKGKHVQDVVDLGLVDKSVSLEVIRLNRQASFVQKVSPSGKHLHVSGMPIFKADGAIDYIVVTEKDVTDLRNMRRTVEETRQSWDKTRERLSEMELLRAGGPDMVAESTAMRNVMHKAIKLARFESPHILIEGESGTGKKTLARYIHQHGRRSSGPFIHVNCAAIPHALHEAELFGYVKGAVPGGSGKGKAGLLDLGQGGTIVLEEVAALSEHVQAKLLRCIQEGGYSPLGGRAAKSLDATLVATTQAGLQPLVARGLFREDLFHVLHMFSLRIPPLRERPDDIGPLAEALVHDLNKELKTDMSLSAQAIGLLRKQPLPGNVVELHGLLKTAIALSDRSRLDAALARILEEDEAPALGEPGAATLKERLEALERDIIRNAAGTCATTREMALHLGISQPSVVRKLKKYNLRLAAFPAGRSISK